MKLRIISGVLKGRYVTIDDGIDFRPTQERIRESVAEILKRRLRGAVAADVCAGSGAFGFEMLSRYAARVDFVESGKLAALRIGENAKALGVEGRVRIVREDVKKFIDGMNGLGGVYDIIFYDPPYGDAELSGLVPKLFGLIKPRGLLVYERRRLPTEKKNADTSGKANLVDVRLYSDTAVEFYGGEEDADSDLPGDV
ncbi:MAG: RsmD family RNA methyltransferase [Chitinispirillales bacterium]|jgi:16S rRNA (guanine966-N2)-methyltransferase|nr:RsmD family RNA methyltransferase [Chitinispirillales bacterium]